MSALNQADALMGIFGLSRAKCCHCVHSIGTDKLDMFCAVKNELVDRDSQCKNYTREVGSDE